MVTFASREIRGGGLIKFFYSYFILAACESREDFLDLRASGETLEATEKCKNVKMQPCNHEKKVKHGGKSMKN